MYMYEQNFGASGAGLITCSAPTTIKVLTEATALTAGVKRAGVGREPGFAWPFV